MAGVTPDFGKYIWLVVDSPMSVPWQPDAENESFSGGPKGKNQPFLAERSVVAGVLDAMKLKEFEAEQSGDVMFVPPFLHYQIWLAHRPTSKISGFGSDNGPNKGIGL